jgi:hypothetical protein
MAGFGTVLALTACGQGAADTKKAETAPEPTVPSPASQERLPSGDTGCGNTHYLTGSNGLAMTRHVDCFTTASTLPDRYVLPEGTFYVLDGKAVDFRDPERLVPLSAIEKLREQGYVLAQDPSPPVRLHTPDGSFRVVDGGVVNVHHPELPAPPRVVQVFRERGYIRTVSVSPTTKAEDPSNVSMSIHVDTPGGPQTWEVRDGRVVNTESPFYVPPQVREEFRKHGYIE